MGNYCTNQHRNILLQQYFPWNRKVRVNCLFVLGTSIVFIKKRRRPSTSYINTSKQDKDPYRPHGTTVPPSSFSTHSNSFPTSGTRHGPIRSPDNSVPCRSLMVEQSVSHSFESFGHELDSPCFGSSDLLTDRRRDTPGSLIFLPSSSPPPSKVDEYYDAFLYAEYIIRDPYLVGRGFMFWPEVWHKEPLSPEEPKRRCRGTQLIGDSNENDN